MQKKVLGLLCISFVFFTVHAQSSIKDSLYELLNDSTLQHANLAFEVRNVSNDSVIYSHNSNVSLTPASTMKTVSTAAALEILGPGFKFKTNIAYSGSIDAAGVLHGNIYIVGGGDPCLGSRFFTNDYGNFIQKWAAAIQSAGIKKINGAVIADASLYGAQSVPNEWIWGDIGNYYGSGSFALSAYDNAFTASYHTSKVIGGATEITKIEPYIPYLKVDNYVKTGRTKSDHSFFYGGPHQYTRISHGKLPHGRSGYQVKGSIPDPGLLLAYQLDSALGKIGISTKAHYEQTYTKPTAITKVIYTTSSPTLRRIIDMTNHFSVNLFAEQIFRYLGWYKTHSSAYENCIQVVRDFWGSKGLDTNALFMFDGCGLSPHDAVSPHFFCDLMIYMHNKSKVYKYFVQSLPLSCHSGTLIGFCSGSIACGRVTAKSGSINDVKSYTGYVRTLSGNLLAFAIMINNFNCSIHDVHKKLVPLMVAMVKYK